MVTAGDAVTDVDIHNDIRDEVNKVDDVHDEVEKADDVQEEVQHADDIRDAGGKVDLRDVSDPMAVSGVSDATVSDCD